MWVRRNRERGRWESQGEVKRFRGRDVTLILKSALAAVNLSFFVGCVTFALGALC